MDKATETQTLINPQPKVAIEHLTLTLRPSQVMEHQKILKLLSIIYVLRILFQKICPGCDNEAELPTPHPSSVEQWILEFYGGNCAQGKLTQNALVAGLKTIFSAAGQESRDTCPVVPQFLPSISTQIQR